MRGWGVRVILRFSGCLSKIHFKFWCMRTDERVCGVRLRHKRAHNRSNERVIICNSQLGFQMQRPFP